MGARIILCDPHRVVVTGPAQLYGERLTSPDIRAGMAMLIAALCAEGTSTIGNVAEIDRGYERIDERLRSARRPHRARRGRRRLPRTAAAWTSVSRARRMTPVGRHDVNVATGMPVLDHLLDAARAQRRASSSRSSCRPADAEAEVAAAGTRARRAFARAAARATASRGHGSAFMPADEALAQVALEAPTGRSWRATST